MSTLRDAAKALIDYETTGAPDFPEWDARFAALRAALGSETPVSTLRERIAALVHGPRPTLDEWFDPYGRVGLVRSALESETREADAYDLICDDCGLSGTCDAYDHGRRRPCADFARPTPPPANTENDR